MWKISDLRASPQQSQLKKQPNCQQVDIFAATNPNHALKGMGDLLRSRQEGVILFAAASRAARTADSPDPPFIAPKLHEAPEGPFIVFGVAGVRSNLAGIGALLTGLADLMGLSGVQNMETASRLEKAKNAAWGRLVRERGNAGLVRGEPARLNRDR